MSRELRFSDKKRPTTFKKTHEFIPIDAPQKVLMENLGLKNWSLCRPQYPERNTRVSVILDHNSRVLPYPRVDVEKSRKSAPVFTN